MLKTDSIKSIMQNALLTQSLLSGNWTFYPKAPGEKPGFDTVRDGGRRQKPYARPLKEVDPRGREHVSEFQQEAEDL